MNRNSIGARLARSLTVPSDNPELLKAQFAALSRLIPLMYFILVANTWVLAANYISRAPVWLTVFCPLTLTIVSGIRLVDWWRKRNMVVTTEAASRALVRTNCLAGFLSAAFSAWAISLFPYGDDLARAHIAFYMANTVIACIICLMHLRSAALIVTAVVNTAFVGFFGATGNTTFIAMAINAVLITVVLLIVVLIQNRDFSRMVNAQTEARRKDEDQSRLLRMIDDMPVAVMTVERDTLNINYANETSKRLIGRIEHLLPIKADALLGTSIDVFHRHPQHQRRILADPKNLPHNARIKLGPEILDLKVSAVTADDGSYLGPMLTWALVTKEVEAENRILHLAHYDTLTELPNRNSFYQELDQRLITPGNRACLLFIDLDGFKLVNDTRGHYVGDALLKQVADRLRTLCNMPATIVGRLGGDEFAILLPHSNAEEAAALATRIAASLGMPYNLDYDRNVQIGASIGIALAPAHGENSQTLLAHADMALYAAKNAGKGTFRLFSEDMETRLQERVRLEAKLRVALENQEGLFVFYQPIVDIETDRITAREALVRWHHPERGWISPAEFVPIAEQSGLIDQLGLFVLNRACNDAVAWEDGARVAVNISAAQLGKGTLAPTVLQALVASGLSRDRLEIEVTETALLNDEHDAIGDLRRLHDMGVRVALDDFGTGYSSLAHLRDFPFDKIKIDGSFVKAAVERPECAAIVKAVADLGKRLGVTTVAEGVETQAHLDRIRQEGCREVQGYLYGRPMPSERDAPIVEEINRAPSSAAMPQSGVGTA
ncbi:MAG TPA: EAL domain-containing protein [Rhizobium sp.]